MMSGPQTQVLVAALHDRGVPAADPPPWHALRLRLKPKESAAGYLDGGWWPRSRDLTAELPALAEVLGIRLGTVRRVAYSMDGWDDAPRQTEVDGHTVRLEGFRSQDPHLLQITGDDNRHRISLLVVPPDADAEAAHDALMTSAVRTNVDSPAEILLAHGVLVGANTPEG
jgi:hypothetical protein